MRLRVSDLEFTLWDLWFEDPQGFQYCRELTIGGLKKYQHYFGGFLIIVMVYWAPKPYSNY